ncbi:phage repressor protein CI [Vibrio algicola]|uniref:Transcriptional regulator n=1 Tax=Vibrio algicola TaxID=2662262 RepID=A0A5Q0TIL9_9VIBR|nr:phage repressor protein CI [Vibrio algicola]
MDIKSKMHFDQLNCDLSRQINYKSGIEFIKKLKLALNLDQQLEIADAFGVSKSTVASWVQRDLTPYELAIRLHLHTGLSLRWLLLDEGEMFSAGNSYSIQESKQIHSYADKRLQPKKLFDIDTFDLKGSKLNLLGTTTIDQTLLDDFGVQNVLAIKELYGLSIVDKENTNPISGYYLIDIDGVYSINKIQRVPGKILALTFNSDVVEFPSDEIRVLGKVVIQINKK